MGKISIQEISISMDSYQKNCFDTVEGVIVAFENQDSKRYIELPEVKEVDIIYSFIDTQSYEILKRMKKIEDDKNKIAEIIMEAFFSDNPPTNLWHYGDMLYSLKRYKYLPEYLKIVSNSTYGSDRQMVIILLGKSKKTEVIPVLLELTEDKTVFGHAIQALTNFEGEQIVDVMQKYKDCDVKWISKVVRKYLDKRSGREEV